MMLEMLACYRQAGDVRQSDIMAHKHLFFFCPFVLLPAIDHRCLLHGGSSSLVHVR
jgi:hypothetical protein